jgi:hypothetical protein
MAKKLLGQLKLQIPAGSANPSPPVGPALGQRGINIMEFCKAFNAKTADMEPGAPCPTVISYYQDKSFTMDIKTPPAITMSSFPFATLQINAEKIEKLFTMEADEPAAFRSAKYIPETGQFKNGNSTYVIRIVSVTPDEMQLRSDFLRTFLQFRDHKDRNGKLVFGQSPADPNQRIQIGSGWLQDLHDEVGVQWNREASRMQR